MSASVVSSACRLTIISSTLRVDLAVPVALSVAELLSIVVSSLGRETADLGAAEGGWVLQRAAEAPLDPAATIAASQLRDGDVLHLRTRASHLPEIAFDDVLDAVATGVSGRTARWRGAHTARAASTFGGALLGYALVTLMLLGPGWTTTAISCGVAALLLLLAATALARAYDRRGPALVAAAFAVAYGAAAGATSVGGSRALTDFGAAQALVAVSAATLVSVVALLVLLVGVPGLMTVATAAVLAAIGTAVASLTPLSGAETSAVVATAALAVSPFLPTLSFRLSRLPLPAIPLDAADLRRDTGTVDSRQILAQAVRADEFLTGLVGGVAIAIAASAALITGHGVTEQILAVVLGLICLLRARLFTGRAQRALLLASGGLALLACVITGVLDADSTGGELAYAIGAVVVALTLLGAAVVLPERRVAPPLARAADIVESLLVLSVIPLALGVIGVYGAVRLAAS